MGEHEERKADAGEGGEEKGAAVIDVQELFDDIGEYIDLCDYCSPFPISMGELSEEDGLPLMHPTRQGVVVGRRDVHDFKYAPSFVEECMAASSGDVNALLNYTRGHYPKK
jgi:hypothetical protein